MRVMIEDVKTRELDPCSLFSTELCDEWPDEHSLQPGYQNKDSSKTGYYIYLQDIPKSSL